MQKYCVAFGTIFAAFKNLSTYQSCVLFHLILRFVLWPLLFRSGLTVKVSSSISSCPIIIAASASLLSAFFIFDFKLLSLISSSKQMLGYMFLSFSQRDNTCSKNWAIGPARIVNFAVSGKSRNTRKQCGRKN